MLGDLAKKSRLYVRFPNFNWNLKHLLSVRSCLRNMTILRERNWYIVSRQIQLVRPQNLKLSRHFAKSQAFPPFCKISNFPATLQNLRLCPFWALLGPLYTPILSVSCQKPLPLQSLRLPGKVERGSAHPFFIHLPPH